MKGPILAHVVTQKGRGYLPAEKNPARFHSVAPFNLETGEPLERPLKSVPAFTEVFGKTLCRLARENQRIIAITAAMQSGTGLELFSKEFPGRFYDIGIAEQHAVTFAAGLALEGMKPVVAVYSTFLQRAYDQIQQDVCLQSLPVVFALDRGGVVGEDGPTHHGLFDLSYLRHLPNVIIMAPKDENEFQHMIRTAIECGQPVAFRYPRGKGIGVALDDEIRVLEVGRGEILKEGEDVLIIAFGSTVYPALHASEQLEESGIRAAVINSRFLKPLDEELLCLWAKRTGRVVTVEENALPGGFGSAVLELFQERGLFSIEVKRLGIPDLFVENGPPALLRSKYRIDAASIAREARGMLGTRLKNRAHVQRL
jgi:1-deoxy-D-xylulose-5-phosphate synthase